MLGHILIFNISFIITFFFLKKIKKKQDKLRYENMFFYRKNQIVKSFLVAWSVIFCFLIVYRIVRFILRKNLYIDISFLSYYISINVLIFCLFMCYVLLKLRFLVKFFVKKHFLKIHYYSLLRYRFYVFFTDKIFDLGFNVNKKYLFLYKILFFCINDLLNYVVVLMLLKNIIFDKGVIFLGLLPVYGMYYFCLNYIKFVQQMRPDFERISLQFYYSNSFDLSLKQLENLYIYHNELVFNEKKYYFDYSYRFDETEVYPVNWIFISEQEVSIEIYSVASKHKPELFPPRIYSIE